SREFSIFFSPASSFTPERSRHLIRFSSPATSITTKFCRGRLVSHSRFIFRGWKFSAHLDSCFVFYIVARCRFWVCRSLSSRLPRLRQKFADSISPAAVSVTPANTGVSQVISRRILQFSLGCSRFCSKRCIEIDVKIRSKFSLHV